MTQHLRQSQFVLTLGPGSILEGPFGPRIISRPDLGLFYPNGLNPADFEISDQRMSQGLLGGNRIFRLPSNAELGLPATRYIYRTRPFPEWKICYNTSGHHYKNDREFPVLFLGNSCPLCRNNRADSIRFVRACVSGHLDDVDWYFLVHKSSHGCSSNIRWFIWKEFGSSLNQIFIKCPGCGSMVNFGQAYRSTWQCSGRFPERENITDPPARPGCEKEARIIQRQASNLRIPEIKILFTIPPRYTRLHNLLQLPYIHGALVANPPDRIDKLEQMLENLKSRGFISVSVKQEILSSPWNEIQHAINDVVKPVNGSYTELLIEEFHAFIEGSNKGIPPIHGKRPHSPPLIEINPNMVTSFRGPRGYHFRIVPVRSLRTVIVQTGYRREVDTSYPAQTVDVSFRDRYNPQQRWYPGMEFFGEGIFIMLDKDDGWHFNLTGDNVNRWLEATQAATDYPGHIFRDMNRKDELHPGFVWWHTLSHLLIRAISAQAGYPLASIRERVYIELSDGNFRGGILLYVVQPGSSGSMGGLIALVQNRYIREIFARAFTMLEHCSGDPLCSDNIFVQGRYCGQACYSCLFLPETSCEHRNMWLDRGVLRDNLP